MCLFLGAYNADKQAFMGFDSENGETNTCQWRHKAIKKRRYRYRGEWRVHILSGFYCRLRKGLHCLPERNVWHRHLFLFLCCRELVGC